MFGNPETTPGGRALKFYASVRIDVRRTGTIKEGEVSVGNRVRARVVKNKIAPPFRDAEFDIMFDSRHQLRGRPAGPGRRAGRGRKTGLLASFGEVRLGQGREQAKNFLSGNKDLAEEIRTAVLAKGLPPVDAKPTPADASGEETAEA